MSALITNTTEAARKFVDALDFETAEGKRDAMTAYLSTVLSEVSKAIKFRGADLDYLPDDDELAKLTQAVWGDQISEESCRLEAAE